MIDLQKLYTVRASSLRDTALRICGVLQKTRGEDVVVGAATFFLAVCKRYNLDVRRVLETTDRVMKDSTDKHPVEMRALSTYLRKELND